LIELFSEGPSMLSFLRRYEFTTTHALIKV
jgi:hypothetical protein